MRIYTMSLLSIIEYIRVRLDSIYYHAVCHRFASIGKGVYIGRLAQLVGPHHIHISDGVSIGRGCYLLAVDCYQGQRHSPNITLGREVVIGAMLPYYQHQWYRHRRPHANWKVGDYH